MLKVFFILVFASNIFFIKPTSANPGGGFSSKSVSSTSSSSYVSANSTTYINENHKPHHKCGPNERFVMCPDTVCVPKTCEDVGYPVPCIDLASDGKCSSKPCCICNEGYVRNNKGVCIPIKQCPSCGDDDNAESGCGFECGKHCTDLYNDEPKACILICRVNGCQCKPGKYYDEVTKKCVDPRKCTKVCRDNEVLSNCTNGGCERKNCSQLDEPKKCVKPHICKKGCICKDGYLRDSFGTCVPTHKCPPPKCDVDEVVFNCINGGCNKKNCSQLRDPDICIDPVDCIRGCICKDGYLRNDRGICVPIKTCQTCTRPHEISDPCPPTCPPQTCESINRTYDCPLIITNSSHCKPACRCEENYFRNKIGECISKTDCLKCTGPHEYFSCGSACDNVCDTLRTQNQTNCPIKNKTCNKKCYCEKGYARAKNNTCISIDKCDEPQCPLNEKYEKCPALICNTKTCSQLGYPIICIHVSPNLPCPGKPGCICIDGYLRNDKGVCVPKEQCSKVCQDNEVLSNCTNGGCERRNCSQLDEPKKCVQPQICNKGCVCKDGYLQHPNGTCVPTDKCPSPNCGENEIVSDCVNGGCEKKNCSQLGQPDVCIDTADCIRGCICKDKYLRNDKGVCVPMNQCPQICGTNETYFDCIQGQCGPKNCSELGKPLPCPRIDPTYCIGGCLCKEGYVKSDKAICIPKKQCPSCGDDPNAGAGCGGNCNKRCSDIGQEPRLCPAICEINGCDCKPGFVYDDNTKNCVASKDCTPVCFKNEVYTNCTEAQCGPKNCTDLGKAIPCPAIDPDSCTDGCICKDGYVRNKNGDCIPRIECQALVFQTVPSRSMTSSASCGGDPNARSGCGTNCNKKCSDVGKESVSCILICYDNACDCKDGFYYDQNINKCVPSKNCTLQCTKPHEHYVPCYSPCPPQTCDSIDKLYKCPRIDLKAKCEPGCQCDTNYFRNLGQCITRNECPTTTTNTTSTCKPPKENDDLSDFGNCKL